MNRLYARLSLAALACLLCLSGLALPALAKDAPPQVILWPATGKPVVRFTFGKLKQLASIRGQYTYTIDTQVENLWTKPISDASFDLYLFDKNNVRIGEGWISVSNAAPGDIIKFQTNIQASGQPVSMKVEPRSLPAELQGNAPAKTIDVTINSIPQGAQFTLDGKPMGITPRVIEAAVGTHMLEFDKEGFNHGKYPFAIGPHDVSGASVSYELGTSAHDTIELRDGTVISGDLLSVSATDIVVRVGGNPQSFSRNQVRRILLAQRDDNSQ
ncbi:MAG TPA: PEGA domain-containing protein [Acidobacteriaceae bacterium]|jgi:hypothetical protein|nr:PEGA domain-containing protein [Acidobacteriaceae bacterium]